MKLNRICMTTLLLGAAAIATPAFAEDQAAADASAQNNAAVQTADASAGAQTNAAGQAAMDDTKLAASGNASSSNQAAANSSGSDVGARSAANANVDAVGDTSKKYRRGSRSADFAKEQEITKQLNSQAASAAAPSGANRL
jgi:hypothetical protein